MDYTREITLESVPIANPDCVFREDASGWTALVNLDNASGIALNETGVMIWEAMTAPKTAAEIAAYVGENTEGADNVLADVEAFLESLLPNFAVVSDDTAAN
jgi:hypothetical protein